MNYQLITTIIKQDQKNTEAKPRNLSELICELNLKGVIISKEMFLKFINKGGKYSETYIADIAKGKDLSELIKVLMNKNECINEINKLTKFIIDSLPMLNDFQILLDSKVRAMRMAVTGLTDYNISLQLTNKMEEMVTENSEMMHKFEELMRFGTLMSIPAPKDITNKWKEIVDYFESLELSFVMSDLNIKAKN